MLIFFMEQMLVILDECGLCFRTAAWKEIIWVTHFQTLTHTSGFKFNMYFLKKAMNVNSLLIHYPTHLNPMFY